MLHPAIITAGIVGIMTGFAVVIWSIRQPELRQGWRAVFKRIKEAHMAQYHPDDITECIKMYWRIVGDIADAPGMDELQSLTIDMEVFRRKFVDRVPDGLYDDKMLSMIQIYDKHWRRIMYQIK